MNYAQFFTVVAAYLISGAVILRCLSKLKMRVAFNAFLVMFFVVSLYIPIVCGTGAMRLLLIHTLTERADAQTLADSISSPSYSLVPYFSLVTLMLVFAAVIMIAILIVTVMLVRHIVKSFRRSPHGSLRRRAAVRSARPCPVKTRKIYLEFCRLLN